LRSLAFLFFHPIQEGASDEIVDGRVEHGRHSRIGEGRPEIFVDDPDAFLGALDDAPEAIVGLGRLLLRIVRHGGFVLFCRHIGEVTTLGHVS
jgi:hypothetical protein